MPQFIIKSECILNNLIRIDDKDLYKHIIRVLRAKQGERLFFLDENQIRYETILSNIEPAYFECEIQKKYKSERKLNLNLHCAQSVLNSDAQISAIQKATELGVKSIIPLHTDFCAVKESVIRNKIDKWRKIAVESVKQCERADIPEVRNLMYLKDLIGRFDRILVFAERNTDIKFKPYIKDNPIKPDESILVVIGPEGGFSDNEFKFFADNKFALITMGKLIYRADTALTAALTTVINGADYE